MILYFASFLKSPKSTEILKKKIRTGAMQQKENIVIETLQGSEKLKEIRDTKKS